MVATAVHDVLLAKISSRCHRKLVPQIQQSKKEIMPPTNVCVARLAFRNPEARQHKLSVRKRISIFDCGSTGGMRRHMGLNTT